jgi:hypothetical protein
MQWAAGKMSFISIYRYPSNGWRSSVQKEWEERFFNLTVLTILPLIVLVVKLMSFSRYSRLLSASVFGLNSLSKLVLCSLTPLHLWMSMF